jgi:hypothetical protein
MRITVTRAERERALVALAEIFHEENVNVVIQTADLAKRAGITEEQAVLAFRWMLENDFANGNVQGCGQIGITFKGIEEAQRLKLPKWRRWWYKESIRTPLVVSLIGGSLGSLIVLIVGFLLKLLTN